MAELPSIEQSGKGIWISIHTFAKGAFSEEQKRAFLVFITQLAQNFYCEKCQIHFLKYLEKHPIINYWHRSEDTEHGYTISGMFIWSWEFHNEVNKYLKKPLLTLNEAYNLYEKSCSTCGLNNIIIEKTPIYQPLKFGYNSLIRRISQEKNN
jgi:hypothetical protein